jgi:transcriptional regulator with XRE-family HTH domain
MTIHIGNKIKQLVDSHRKMTNKEIAEKLGMTEVNFYKVLKKEDLSTELLKKIAEILGVSVSWFFQSDYKKVGEEIPSIFTSNDTTDKTIADQLTKLLEQKDKLIDQKDKQIEFLQRELEKREQTIDNKQETLRVFDKGQLKNTDQ